MSMKQGSCACGTTWLASECILQCPTCDKVLSPTVTESEKQELRQAADFVRTTHNGVALFQAERILRLLDALAESEQLMSKEHGDDFFRMKKAEAELAEARQQLAARTDSENRLLADWKIAKGVADQLEKDLEAKDVLYNQALEQLNAMTVAKVALEQEQYDNLQSIGYTLEPQIGGGRKVVPNYSNPKVSARWSEMCTCGCDRGHHMNGIGACGLCPCPCFTNCPPPPEQKEGEDNG